MTSVLPENASDWRELSDNLTPTQIAHLEALEIDIQSDLFWPGQVPPGDEDGARLLVRLAQRDVLTNLWAMMLAGVRLPVGAVFGGDWEGDGPHRVVFGGNRGVDGHQAAVQTASIQFADGRVDDGRLVEAPSVTVLDADHLTSVQARELASALLAAADEIDGWAR